MAYWLLTTHAFAAFPIGCFLWSWKRRKDHVSLLMLVKFIYAVFYSLLYHQHHSLKSDRLTDHDDYEKWALLDGYACSTLIFSTVLYVCRMREPYVYLVSFTIENAVLGFFLWYELIQNTLLTWYILLCSIMVSVVKWKTLYRYLLYYKCLSFLSVACGLVALAMYLIASEHWHSADTYTKYHSLWHCFIFSTAGFGALLRYSLDERLYPIVNRRDQLDSI